MRALLILLVLAAGIAIGGAVPGIATHAQSVLATLGLKPAPAVPSMPAAKSDNDHDQAAKPDAHGHSHAGEGGEEKEHGEAGEIHMTAEQITSQEIRTAPVTGGTLSRHLVVPGTVIPDADRLVRVPARVVGTVAEMRKRLGDKVQKGDVVAVLDSREVADAKSDFLTAGVQAELQKINFERQQKLLNTQATAQVSFDQARATYQESQLRLDLARQKLSALGLNAAEVAAAAKRDEATPNQSSLRMFPLRAPMEGRIVERKVDVGTKVGGESDPADVYTIADLSAVWVELAVPTTALINVQEGAKALVGTGTDEKNLRAEGQVVFISPLLNADTRSARVIVALPNPDQAWRPGMFVTASVAVAEDTVPVRVPRTALQTVEGKLAAFVRTDEGFERREVKVGRSDDQALEVTEGLSAGEEIAVANTFLLKAELGKAEADHDH
ncbi:cation transporter [Methylobacterium sp. Leaf122]|nr:efflux RND transporter periplasmic adaptor subunit [Methylobacterium sp. Leaf122]KQQ17602.1 cation transporter [Methylobacterium sp. Leaf122]